MHVVLSRPKVRKALLTEALSYICLPFSGQYIYECINDMFDSFLKKFNMRSFQYMLFLARRGADFSCLEWAHKFHLSL